MKFQRICDQLCPADQEAVDLYAGLRDGDVVEVQVVVSRRRTGTQSNAMHLWCDRVAKALNEAGYDMLCFPWKEGIEIPFSKEVVKVHHWKPVQIAMTGHESTTKPKTVDYPAIFDVLNRKYASLENPIHVPWPSDS